jgi:cysteine-rich repeat protein
VNTSIGEECEFNVSGTIDETCDPVTCQFLPPPPQQAPPNCGDGILQSNEGEFCDDGNIISGDGCSRFCEIEKCPRIRYRKDVSDKDVSVDCTVGTATTSDPCDDGLCVTSSTPFICFDLVDKGSLEASCISGDPYVGYHDEVDDCSNFISDRTWSKAITNICVEEDYLCIDEDCNFRIAVGTDFMCTEDCEVCGDGIVQGTEECDTGILEDDNCFYCRIGCTCDANTTKPCTGECFGGQVTDGTICDPRSVGNPCIGGMCVPTACCGDSIIQPPEECDDANNVNNDTCADNCTLTGMAKRQYIEPRDIKTGLSQHILQKKVFKAKTIDINQWIFDFWDAILDILNIDASSSDLIDTIAGWFTKTGIDITLPPSERGVVWYAVFPWLLRAPYNLDCSLGIGSAETIRVLAITILPISLFLGLIIPTGWLSIFFMAFGLFFLTLFLGIAYGYPFPGAFLTPSLPPVPECLISDLANTCEIINSPCINWPEGVVLDPPDGSCQPNRTLLDCRDIGWNDGFDWLVFVLEYHAPDFMDSFRDSYLFSMLTMHQYWVDIFDRFDYGGGPIPDVDLYYCAPTASALGIGTILTIAIVVSALLVGLGYLGVVLYNAFWACWLGNWAVITAWEDWEDERDN